jgi:uncharacterized membrane protein (UPF0136 family)
MKKATRQIAVAKCYKARMHSALFASLVFYALLVLAGGVVGYVKAKSRASLVAGSAFGILLGVAAWLVATGSDRIGAGLAILAALALIGRFLPGFLRTKKVMPAGAVVAAGSLVLLLSVLALINPA